MCVYIYIYIYMHMYRCNIPVSVNKHIPEKTTCGKSGAGEEFLLLCCSAKA